MDKSKLLNEIKKLSVKEQVQIIESVLGSLQPIDPDIETAWIKEAQERLKKVESGKTKLIPGKEVMDKANQILNKW